MRKSLGNKRNDLTDAHIAEITRIYGNFEAGPYSKIFDNDDFGYPPHDNKPPPQPPTSAAPKGRAHGDKEMEYLTPAKRRRRGGGAGGRLGRVSHNPQEAMVPMPQADGAKERRGPARPGPGWDGAGQGVKTQAACTHAEGHSVSAVRARRGG